MMLFDQIGSGKFKIVAYVCIAYNHIHIYGVYCVCVSLNFDLIAAILNFWLPSFTIFAFTVNFGSVENYSNYFHWIAGPGKHRFSC